MEDFMNIVKYLEGSGLVILRKGATGKIENEANEQKGGFLNMFWGISGANLSKNLTAGTGVKVKRGWGWQGVIRASDWVI